MPSVEPITPKDAFAVSPHDTNPLPKKADALWVGVGGNVNLTTFAGTTLIFAVPSGGIVPLQVTNVLNASTTATGIIGLIY